MLSLRKIRKSELENNLNDELMHPIMIFCTL